MQWLRMGSPSRTLGLRTWRPFQQRTLDTGLAATGVAPEQAESVSGNACGAAHPAHAAEPQQRGGRLRLRTHEVSCSEATRPAPCRFQNWKIYSRPDLSSHPTCFAPSWRIGYVAEQVLGSLTSLTEVLPHESDDAIRIGRDWARPAPVYCIFRSASRQDSSP